jgi:hypothetical protein
MQRSSIHVSTSLHTHILQFSHMFDSTTPKHKMSSSHLNMLTHTLSLFFYHIPSSSNTHTHTCKKHNTTHMHTSFFFFNQTPPFFPSNQKHTQTSSLQYTLKSLHSTHTSTRFPQLTHTC